MRIITILVACIVSVILLSGTGLAQSSKNDPATLRVALLPDENASTIIQDNQGLKNYLESQLKKKIELVVTTDYSSMIEAMRFGRLELAYFGPVSYLLARSKSDIEPFAALESGGSTTYTAVVIGNKAQGIDSISAIKGKTVAFGDPASTSSHLVPRAFLLENGVEGGKDYTIQHVGAHDAVVRAVEAGHAQAGGLSRPIFNSLVERGLVDLNKVVVITDTWPIPQYPWTMRSDLTPELKQAIRKAFYELKDDHILTKFKAERFAPIDDSAYDPLRKTAKILNIDLEKM